ncbi:MAG: SufB/SufD family protein [Acidimicrobiales bacterium]
MPIGPAHACPSRRAPNDRGSALNSFAPDASATLGGPDWLTRRRATASERLVASALPTEAEEVWRYSGIDDFDLGDFAPAGDLRAAVEEVAAARVLADRFGPRAALVVTHNGSVVALELSPGTPAGVVTVAGSGRLSTGGPDGGPPPVLGTLAPPRDAFGSLHDAFVADVVVISLRRGALLADPVVVAHVVDPAAAGSGGALSAFPHTVVEMGPSAEAGVIEVLVAGGARPDGAALVVPVAEIEVGDAARLSYANLQVLGHGSTHLGVQASRVGRDATLRSFTVGLGGRYARVRTDSDLVGQGGHTSLLAAYLGTADQIHDFRTLQDHHAPRTHSELLFTGAVADRSRSVYSGLIRIRSGARGADARQTNHNLVLSEGAHADSVPNLDIDENDVRCSHASTVGPIDEDQRHYLESRGIEPAVAERLIVLGFFSDLAGRSPFAGIARWVEQSVGERLSGRLPAERAAEPTALRSGAEPGGAADG